MTDPTPKLLENVLVALSEGDHQDLSQLGFLPEHPKHVMQRCLRYVFLQGGRVAYGGNLSANGITFDVVRACVEAYSGRQMDGGRPPFIHVIAEYLWRDMVKSKDTLFDHFSNLRGCAEIWLTFADDPERMVEARAHFNAIERKVELIDSKENLPREVQTQEELTAALPDLTRDFAQPADRAASLTSMRKLMAQHCDLWISTGGKFNAYQGARPGIAEEALYAIEAGKRVFPLGAFGGCARDVADALDLLEDEGATPGRTLAEGYRESIGDIRNLRDRWRAQLSDECHAAAKVLANAENPDQAETALHGVVKKCLARQVP